MSGIGVPGAYLNGTSRFQLFGSPLGRSVESGCKAKGSAKQGPVLPHELLAAHVGETRKSQGMGWSLFVGSILGQDVFLGDLLFGAAGF